MTAEEDLSCYRLQREGEGGGDGEGDGDGEGSLAAPFSCKKLYKPVSAKF